jgi:hypothetical protein
VRKHIIGAILASVVLAAGVFMFPRQAAAVVQTEASGAGAGIFPGGANYATVELAGGSFGLSALLYNTGAAKGDVYAQLNGSSLIGLDQSITVIAQLTTGTLNPDGSVTLNGTASIDMGDGTPESTGIAFVAVASATGIQMTLGASALPTLPKSDGWIIIE